VKDQFNREDRGPGVPEAVPHCLQRVAAALGVAALDRIWVFPPLVSGRSESGLLAVSHFPSAPEAEKAAGVAVDGEGAEAPASAVVQDEDRRLLSILPYTAERTGKGLAVEGELTEQGEAPLDRFPRVMEGVVRRTDLDLGDPEELEIEGRDEAFLEILARYDRALLDPTLPPVAEPEPATPAQPTPALPLPGGDEPADLPASPGPEGEPEDEFYDLYTPGSP
jgi:hypothetical protein